MHVEVRELLLGICFFFPIIDYEDQVQVIRVVRQDLSAAEPLTWSEAFFIMSFMREEPTCSAIL